MDNKEKGSLYLIPNVLFEDTASGAIPDQVREAVKQIDYYLAENIRTARRYFSSLKTGKPIEGMQFEVLDKKTRAEALPKLFTPIFDGHDVGVVSESGCPGVADPGALAVSYAHQKGIKVIPLVGPSSIIMALMSSGFSGQRFAFHGYLPIDKKEIGPAIKRFEKESMAKKQTQIFIETPYRNNQLLEAFGKHCQPQTQICVAKGITGPDAYIKTDKAKSWPKTKVDLHKVPTVFLMYACP